MLWLTAAILSAFFAGVTSILAKCGIKKTDSDAATAIRTAVVLVFSVIIVLIVGSFPTVRQISARSLIFLILSGIATGASWICYFKALSMGDVNKVVPLDKSSTVLTVVLAVIFFGETANLPVKIVGILLIAAGIFLMIEKKPTEQKDDRAGWFIFALGSAVFAALTGILAKMGIDGVESNLGTALRTCVVLIFSVAIVLARGKGRELIHPDRRELVFIILSGIATGASWLCYYYAIQKGVVSVVVPIDKLSIIVTVGFSVIFLKEKISRRALAGLALMVAGTLAMAIFA